MKKINFEWIVLVVLLFVCILCVMRSSGLDRNWFLAILSACSWTLTMSGILSSILLTVMGIKIRPGLIKFLSLLGNISVPIVILTPAISDLGLQSALPALRPGGILFILGICVIVYSIIALFFIWPKREVAGEIMAVSCNGKVFYPGDNITLYPWINYEIYVIDERETKLECCLMELKCLDGVYAVKLDTDLSFKASRGQEIPEFLDIRVFLVASKEWLKTVFSHYAEDKTLGQMISIQQGDPVNTVISGINVAWNGQYHLTLDEKK